MVANSLSPSLLPLSLSRQLFAEATTVSNSMVFAVNVMDVDTLPVVGEMTADNWSMIAVMTESTGYSVAIVLRTKMVLAVSVGGRFESAKVASNFDRVAELGTNSEVEVTAASSWPDAFAAMTEEGNSAAEELVARTRWVVEAKAESNSQVVVAATVDRTQRTAEARTVDTESAAAETVVSNSVAFEERTANRGSAAVAAVEKLADNW